MRKIVPSQVVAQIARAYPTANFQQLVLRAENSANVEMILALYELIPAQHFSLLPPEDYMLLIMAQARMRTAIEQWRIVGSGGPAMGPERTLGNRHPIAVLRDILATCPDHAPSEAVSEAAWLGDPDLADVLRLDMSTAISALGHGEFKAACVMAGSCIEALLLWALKRKTAPERDAALGAWQAEPKATGRGGPPRQLPASWGDWNLWLMIDISRRMSPEPLLSPEAADAAGSARGYRNLIHPERSDKTTPTMGTAQIGVGAMIRVKEELEALAQAGKV